MHQSAYFFFVLVAYALGGIVITNVEKTEANAVNSRGHTACVQTGNAQLLMDLSGLIVRASLTADHAVCVGARLGDSAVFQVTDLDEDWQRLRLARNGAQTMLAVEQTHLAVSCHADFDVSALEKMAFGNVLQNFLDLMFIERALLNCSGSVPAGPAPALVSE